MSEPRIPSPPRREGETAKAYTALADYCRMGRDRSLEKLRRLHGKKTVRHYETWSAENDWQARVAEYDAAVQRAADEEAEREMLTGLALPRERVRFLKEVLDGLTAEEVRAALMVSPSTAAQVRGMLDDLAKETGGRKPSLDVTTAGQPITGVVFTPPGAEHDDEG